MQYHQITSENDTPSPPCGDRGCRRAPSPGTSGERPRRSAARWRGTAAATTAATAPSPPASAPARGAAARGATATSARRSGCSSSSYRASTGAPSRSPAGCGATSCSRSATRPSTSTSGATRARAGSSGATCGRRARSGANATAPTTAAAGSPASATSRSGRRRSRRAVVGHWEIDTVKGDDQARHTVVTLVERKTGYLVMGKLARHRAADATARTIELIGRHRGRVRTVTADNGTEFHSYAEIEAATGTRFYFATPHHSWERGTNENTNGLSASTCPSAAAWRTSRRPTATRSPRSSTRGRGSDWATGHRRSAMPKAGRRERQRNKCCTSNLNSGRTPNA